MRYIISIALIFVYDFNIQHNSLINHNLCKSLHLFECFENIF